MLEFRELFPEIGMSDTRSIAVVKGDQDLPPGRYFFLEAYCTDRGCDCRRVMLRVMRLPLEEEDDDAPGPKTVAEEIAWIAHAFEPPRPGALVPEQTMLDPLNYQSEYAAGALDLFKAVIIQDPVYRDRLVRHYRMVKDAIATKGHPIHARIREIDGAGQWTQRERDIFGKVIGEEPDPYAPCPCGSGKKYKWCCREKQLRND